MKTFKHWLSESNNDQFPLATRIIIPHERFEGKAYRKVEQSKIPGRDYAYGYGSDVTPEGTPVKKGDTITREAATDLMNKHIQQTIIPSLSKISTWNQMNPNQQEALVSFAYNRGENFWKGDGATTIRQILNDPSRWNEMPSAMAAHNKGRREGSTKKEVMPGLVDRRQEEGILWSTKVPKISTKPVFDPTGKQEITDPEYLKRRELEARAIEFEKNRQDNIPVATRKKHPIIDDQGRKLY